MIKDSSKFHLSLPWVWLLLLTTCALLLRIYAWHMEPLLARDGVYYILQAEAQTDFTSIPCDSLAESNAPPLFISLLHGLSSCGIKPENAGVGLNLIVGSLLVPLVYFIIFSLTGGNRILSWGGAVICTIHPTLGEFSHQVLRETPYLFSLALMMLCLIHAIKMKQFKWWLAVGSCCGLASMFRWEAWEFLPLFLVMALLAGWWKKTTWLETARICGGILAGWLGMIILLALCTGGIAKYVQIVLSRGECLWR